jgi:hypothetical protein
MVSKIFSLLLTSFLLVFISASPALAHDPLILLPDQKTPEQGPLLPNGTISFALYGSLLDGGDQRGFQFKLEPEDRLNISLLIPNLEPENELPKENFPRLFLHRPDGSVLEGVSDLYVEFDEPFSMTRYIRIFDYIEQSSGGLYQVEIVGNHPSRFTASIGYIESFGTPVENVTNRDAGRTGIFDWYQNPVPIKSLELSEVSTTTSTIQEPEVEKPVTTILKTPEIPDGETVAPIIQEPEVEKLNPEIVEKLEKSVEESNTPKAQKVAPKIEETNSGMSLKIYVTAFIGVLFILFSVRLFMRKNSSNRASSQ